MIIVKIDKREYQFETVEQLKEYETVAEYKPEVLVTNNISVTGLPETLQKVEEGEGGRGRGMEIQHRKPDGGF